MKIKSLIVAMLFVLSSVSFAAEMTVQMSKNCRYGNGMFQGYSGDAQVDLVPADESAARKLDILAKRAAEIRGYVTFKVDGVVLSDETVYFPRTGDYRVIKFLVHTAN